MGEDFEYQARSVDNIAAADDLLYISLLGAGKLVIKDDILDFMRLAVGLYFFELACTDIGCLICLVQSLDELFIPDSAGSFGEKLQLIEVFHGLSLPSLFKDDADKDRFFCILLNHRLQK